MEEEKKVETPEKSTEKKKPGIKTNLRGGFKMEPKSKDWITIVKDQ